MNLHRVVLRCSLLSVSFFAIFANFAQGQVRPRVTEAVDDARRVTLKGNVHPLARAEFDRGAVDEAQSMKRALLLLKRSDEQEAALETALQTLQDKSSPSYHQWLTPEQFGAQFGPADADIQAVTSWLTRQGFTVEKVYAGKTVIEFSGTAGQVQRAFGTAIHTYQVEGKTYSANASDPQIPAALAPVVAGVVSLHNFPRQSYARYLGEFRRTIGKPGLQPLFTFPRPNGTGNFYGLGPGDFATIYNSKPLIHPPGSATPIDGTGQTIGIVGETEINLQDVVHFRSMFGLPVNFAASNIIVNGEDPGVTSTGEEAEADLDVQWSGATAPGATVKFVVSASTSTSAGVDLSALYIIEHNLADVMSESYGECEAHLGSAGNAFFNSLWQQAAAQGITVMVSSGDGGSAGCDNFDTQQTATQGLAVSGFASTPYNVSVGGTDFDQRTDPTIYWNATNDATGSSAKGYIPEIPWNENCAQIGLTGCGASAPNGSLNIIAGSGGSSSIYGKPTWQLGVAGMPNDNHRDQPDISLLASPGFDGTGYVVCQQDRNANGLPSCDLNTANGYLDFHIIGGTSASSPAFAGVMALVNQYQAAHGGSARQGNANHTLYALAKKAGASCASSATEAAGCVFNDVVGGNSYIATRYGSSVGTNSVPCQGGTLNCSVASGNGVLVDPAHTTSEAWTAAAGYDMATGLGTVNVNNLATQWGTVSTVATTTTLTLTPSTGITHGTGENVSVNINVKPASGTAAGNVSLIAKFSDGSTQGLDQFALDSNGNVNGTTSSLPGGTNYQVFAHYAGDGTNAPSDSTLKTVSVAPESSQTFIVIPSFDGSGNLLNGNATSVVYGSNYIIRMYVTDKNGAGNATGPPSGVCYLNNLLTCPTGSVTLTNNGAPVGTGGGGAGIFDLNSEGYTRNLAPNLSGGTYSLVASYSGDNSYKASSSSTDIFTVSPAPTSQQWTFYPSFAVAGQPFSLGVVVDTGVAGVSPTGTVTFYDGSSALPGTVSYSAQGQGINVVLYASTSTSIATGGSHTVTAHYSGDPNYGPSTSSPASFVLKYPTTVTQKESSATINYGQSITVTATVTGSNKGPALTGQIQVFGSYTAINGPVTTKAGTDASGNPTLTATVSTTPQSSEQISISYSNDPNYTDVSTTGDFITVNIPDFSLPNSPAITVTAGQTATATINVTPVSNVPGPVTMSVVGGAPGGMNLTFNPATVTLNGSAVPVILSLATVGPSAATASNTIKTQLKWAGLIVGRRRWLSLSLSGALFVLYFLGFPGRRRKYRAAFLASALSVVSVVLGCGGGGGGGGNGGGGGGPVPTSIVITTSNGKVPASGGSFTVTAKVTSSKPITGTVQFMGAQLTFPYPNGVQVVNGTASYTLNLGQGPFPANWPPVGTYNIAAQYSGDANNQPSQTATGINEVFTGTTLVTIQGQTGSLSHQTNVAVTLQ